MKRGLVRHAPATHGPRRPGGRNPRPQRRLRTARRRRRHRGGRHGRPRAAGPGARPCRPGMRSCSALHGSRIKTSWDDFPRPGPARPADCHPAIWPAVPIPGRAESAGDCLPFHQSQVNSRRAMGPNVPCGRARDDGTALPRHWAKARPRHRAGFRAGTGRRSVMRAAAFLCPKAPVRPNRRLPATARGQHPISLRDRRALRWPQPVGCYPGSASVLTRWPVTGPGAGSDRVPSASVGCATERRG
jgi:hypothetical protein